jgi:hypothetical protein
VFCLITLLACSGAGSGTANAQTVGTSATATEAASTTLAAETGNNTSAASAYNQTGNGNAAPGNVSKLPTAQMLYSGATTKVYAELQGWFGQPSHMNVGYASNDPAQVHKQVTDAASRGINGFILDWYGPTLDPVTQQTAVLLKAEAEKNPGFSFAIMEDAGATRTCATTSGCNVTQALINDLTYAYNNFEGSPAYLRSGSRPVVFFFNVDFPNINWTQVRAAVPGNPLFIEEYQIGNSPFTRTYEDGAYGWPVIDTSDAQDWGQSYLASLYSAGAASGAKYMVGAAYKGFNDSLASWTAHRVMSQQCGATYLNTFQQVNTTFSTIGQLDAIQLDTWNDYEEGTEIETGVDNCLSVNAAVSGSTLTFAPSGAGDEMSSVDHYVVYSSTDGQNLTKVTDLPAGSRSVDLAGEGVAHGTSVYVKMQSKPGFLTRVAGPLQYN